MDQRFEHEGEKDPSIINLPTDLVHDLLLLRTGSDESMLDEESELPIFEGFGTALAGYKAIVWCIVGLFLFVAWGLTLSANFDRPTFAIVCAAAVGAALVFTLIGDPNYVRLYKDRIEWRIWGRFFEAHEYRARLDRLYGRILIEDLDGKLIGKLPQIYASKTIELLVSLYDIGRPVSLPQRRPWATYVKGHYIHDSDPINLASLFVMLLPALGIFGSLSLAFVPSALTSFWILPIPISAALAWMLYKSTKRQISGNRYEFFDDRVSKIKAGKAVWTVELKDVRHIGFGVHADSCQFVLVTHYGRKYSLPSTWNIVLPFAIWRGLKLVQDDEVQEHMERPINFKRIGL